jgi:hypothetical protein
VRTKPSALPRRRLLFPLRLTVRHTARRLPTAASASFFLPATIFPATARFLLLIFLWLDFENHFQEIGMIRRELGVVNDFLMGI